MFKNSKYVLALALAVATTGSAVAEQAATGADNGVYVRLDGGYAFPLSNSSKSDALKIGKKKKNAPVFGLGVGYRLSPNFRTDFTVSYLNGVKFQNKQDATTVTTTQSNVSTPLNMRNYSFSSKATALVATLNGYYDIGTFGSFTPYVGAGIGLARTKLTNIALVGNDSTANSADSFKLSSGSKTKTNLAWRLTAGTAVAVAPGFDLDVNYSYLDMGKLKSNTSGDFTLYSNNRAQATTPATFAGVKGRLRAHIVGVGLRYTF